LLQSCLQDAATIERALILPDVSNLHVSNGSKDISTVHPLKYVPVESYL
jgi:hypothetical protein